MATWFYSDPHYGHANIIRHADRPFRDVAEMNRELERRYAERVRPGDLVVWCGDCFWSGFDGAALLAKLPGRKWLTLGNHDSSASHMRALGFERVERSIDWGRHHGADVLVNHYPPARAAYEGREHDERYAARRPPHDPQRVVIHGHTHELIAAAAGRVHVGVDAWDFAPVPWEQVEKLIPTALKFAAMTKG